MQPEVTDFHCFSGQVAPEKAASCDTAVYSWLPVESLRPTVVQEVVQCPVFATCLRTRTHEPNCARRLDARHLRSSCRLAAGRTRLRHQPPPPDDARRRLAGANARRRPAREAPRKPPLQAAPRVPCSRHAARHLPREFREFRFRSVFVPFSFRSVTFSFRSLTVPKDFFPAWISPFSSG